MEQQEVPHRRSASPSELLAPQVLEPLRKAAQALVAKCQAELDQEPSAERAARLHFEIAQTYEAVVGDFVAASKHYQRAVSEAPDHLPAIRGARRVLVELGRFAEALPMFDAELRVTPDPKAKALLEYQRGRFLEEALGDERAARLAYADALDLDGANPTLIKAVERCDQSAREWKALAATYQRAADAVKRDPRHRAALVVARAQLLESALEDPAGAAELYTLALRLDPNAEGALAALLRLYAQRRDWNELIAGLNRAVEGSDDPALRALFLYRVGRLYADRLGNRQEAITALTAAAACVPDEPLVLEELARLYDEAGNHEALATTLREMIKRAPEVGDRLALLHTLGEVLDKRLQRSDEALRCYREAIALDPTHVPVLQAMGQVLAKREDWVGLVDMHLAEATATADSTARAAAHARAAEIYETRLQRLDDAAVHHARALALVPGYPASFKALVRLYSQAGRHRDLIELYERAVDESGSLALKVTYLFKLGSLWEDALEDPVQAAHAYRRILKLEEDSLGALHALQRVCEKAGRYDEVVAALDREAELTEDRPLVVALLHRAGTVLDEHLGDAGSAKLRFQRALELDPAFVPVLASLGRIYYRAGHWDDLLEMYRRQMETTPPGAARAALLAKMGELCERQRGKPVDAIGHYRKAVEIAPGYRPAVRALERLMRETGDHYELARVLERQVAPLNDPAARAQTLYRIAELYEERLENGERAAEFAQRALAEAPSYRPAEAALERLLAATGQWSVLIDYLGQSAEGLRAPAARAAVAARQGEIWRDHLGDEERAIACFEAALDHQDSLAVVLALEPLYLRARRWEALAAVYARQARHFVDAPARLAAWRELARIQETKGVGEPADRARTYEEILALAPRDAEALRGLAALARQISDTEMLARIYVRLGEAELDEGVAAQHWLRLGHVLEATGAPGALEAYRAAMRKAPDSLSAVRGMARIAEAAADWATFVEATRLEAGLTLERAAAAELLVRSAALCIERLDDRKSGEADLERALELWPDSGAAADLLQHLLVQSEQIDRLTDMLARAADSARAPERQTALWLAVADLYTQHKNNPGAAVAALKRALKVDPGHVDAHHRLARLYTQDARWPEAVAAFEGLLGLPMENAARVAIHLEIAAVADQRLGDREGARAALMAALELSPGHPAAIVQLARLQLRAGETAEAETAVRALLEQPLDDADRAAALVTVALIEGQRGDTPGAEHSLCEAVALEGPAGEAARTFEQRTSGGASWVKLAGAVETYIGRVRGREERVQAYLALATIQADRMNLTRKAVEALEQGLIATGDLRLAEALVVRARPAGQLEDATRALVAGLDVHSLRPDLWRLLARAHREMGRTVESRLAASAVRALGETTAEEESIYHACPPRPASAQPGALTPGEIEALAVAGALGGPAAAVVAACAESLSKIYPTDLASFAITRRDRMSRGARHPLRELVDRLTTVIGFDCDVYQHQGATPLVTVGLTDPVCLIVSARLLELPEAQQVFLVGRALLSAALNLHPVVLLSIPELARLLDAATSASRPDFAGANPGPEVADMTHRIKKAISRRARKALEGAAEAYAGKPLADVTAWREAVVHTLDRVAALLADDLAAAAARSAIAESPAGAARPDLVPLLRFWVSGPAMRFRARAGMVPAGRATTPADLAATTRGSGSG
jgi:tetratricopeptide (TPR) repeat protein